MPGLSYNDLLRGSATNASEVDYVVWDGNGNKAKGQLANADGTIWTATYAGPVNLTLHNGGAGNNTVVIGYRANGDSTTYKFFKAILATLDNLVWDGMADPLVYDKNGNLKQGATGTFAATTMTGALTFNDTIKAQFGNDADYTIDSPSANVLELLMLADDGTFNVGNGTNDTDLKWFCSDASHYISIDASADRFKFEDSVFLSFGTGAGAGPGNAGDVYFGWDATQFNLLAAVDDSIFKIGNGTQSFDVWLYGNTTSLAVTWDASASILKLEDSTVLHFGTNGGVGPGNVGDISCRWDATDFDWLCAANNTVMKWGDGTTSFDLWVYGSAAGNYLEWDASANTLYLRAAAALSAVGTGSIGYGTGAGGTITQMTNRTTGVTLSKLTGQITTNNASLAAEAAATFVVTNTLVAATDTIILSQASGSNGGDTSVEVVAVASMQFSIQVCNNNAAGGTAETGAIVINFAVIKGASS